MFGFVQVTDGGWVMEILASFYELDGTSWMAYKTPIGLCEAILGDELDNVEPVYIDGAAVEIVCTPEQRELLVDLGVEVRAL